MMTWKTLAIILLVVVIVENIFIGFGMYLVAEEERMIEECYYDVCSEYADAYIEGNICSCYKTDMFGELVLAKTEVIK